MVSHVWLFATLWTVIDQVPLSMGFFRQEYWIGLPLPPPGDIPDPGIKPAYLTLQSDSFPSKPSRKPPCNSTSKNNTHTQSYLKMMKILKIFRVRHTNGQLMHERYSASLIIREMKIKTTVRCCFMPVRMTVNKKTTNVNKVVENRIVCALFVGI